MTMLGSNRDDKPKAQRRVVLDLAPSFYDEIEAAGLEHDMGVTDAIYQACRDFTNRSGELELDA